MTRAVVVGGSIAGLLAAAALAGTFDEVLVLERDRLSADEGFRPGAPQARHAHGMLLRGARAVERLLPGLQEELRADGAAVVDMGERLLVSNQGQAAPRQALGLPLQLFSRNFLETRMRHRVEALPGVTVRDATSVTGLCAAHGGTRITGVTVQAAGENDAPVASAEVIDADLVVDASGRNSRAANWLGALGYPAPEEVVVDAGQSYVTAWLDRHDALSDTGGAVYEIGQHRARGRGGMGVAIEGGRIQVLLFGRGSDQPSTDPAEFRVQARRLGSPMLTALAEAVGPGTPLYTYAKLINRRRLHHRMPRRPERFVVMGDALCIFNPVYGQGMTVAALQAEDLRTGAARLLRAPGGTRALQRRLARRTSVPWLLATAQDSRWTDRPSPLSPVCGWLLNRMVARIAESPQLHKGFLQILQLVGPTALADPRALYALLRPGPTRRSRRAG
ncbi:FAD-dependent monooxygenase [Kitasatospora cathayae]|uniref:FAD-dependent monooxygenase n=1 Tax=Kitasatospora cathayae TaxID=3004092 RepID=A0ABY7QDM9_9ACTN|nr:FAD-dependent monooxygenase [Kitasatospora sp. HUAS 3-15]WBP90805.1 FAD-dependent monooxygenase [Kitasatospora sp. HUAS 3-15]